MNNAYLLGLINPAIALLFGLTFLILWSRQKHRWAILAFAASYGCLGVGFLISHLTPDWTGLLNVFVLDSIYILGTSLMVWGICTRLDIRPPMTALTVMGVVGLALIMVVNAYGVTYNSSLLVANAVIGGIMVFGAWLIRRNAFEGGVEALVFWAIFLAGSQFWIRSGITLTMETVQAGEAYRDSTYWAVLNASVALFSVVVALSLIAACATDLIKEVRTISETDLLTGLPNRRAFDTAVDDALVKCARAGVPTSLVLLDIDHFKQVNDTYGHQTGDKVIAELGTLIREIPRESDVSGRLGGEEFGILLWNADIAGARLFAEGLRTAFKTRRIDGLPRKQGCTISIGAAQLQDAEDFDDLYARADAALYRAKNGGRNRVECDGKVAPALRVVA